MSCSPKIVLVLLVSSGLSIADEPATAVPDDARIETLVRDLGDSDFFVREAATRELWAAGPDRVRSVLERARDGRDAEVAFRARRILWNFDHGILVDTPPELVELVARFHAGNAATRVSIVKMLTDGGRLATLTALYGAIPENERPAHRALLLRGAGEFVPTLIAAEKYDEARGWLEFAARLQPISVQTNGRRGRDLAAFLLLRGKLDEHLAGLTESEKPTPDDHAALLWGRMLNGDREAANDALPNVTDRSLRLELALRRGDWATLADPAVTVGDPGVERLGFRATFQHLAGFEEPLAATVAELRQLAKDEPDQAWMCGEALLIAERWDDAVDVFRDAGRESTAFELLATRQRYREAFTLLGLAPDGSDAVAWFERRVTAANDEAAQLVEAVGLAFIVAGELRRTRGDAAAGQLLASTRAIALRDDVKRTARLIATYAELGFEEEALREAAVLLGSSDATAFRTALPALFPGHESAAFLWWKFRRGIEKEESPEASLAWVFGLFGGKPVDEFADLARRMIEIGAKQTKPETTNAWWQAVGEVAVERKEWDVAAEASTAIAEALPTLESMLAAGDVALKREQWAEAAAWYERAAAVNHVQPLAPYLQGLALIRAATAERQPGDLDAGDDGAEGDDSEGDGAEIGRRLVERARLIPLADTAQRRLLAEGLSERGFDVEARREWETILQVGVHAAFEGSDAWAVQMAFARLGNFVGDDDPLRAADCWQRYSMYLLKTNAAYTEAQRYLAVTHIQHRARARGHVVAGHYERAMSEAKAAHAAWPGNIELALSIVPLLDTADRADEADELFELVNAAATLRASTFPENAGAHNDLAWLQARCQRRLADALQHAERAVALEPDSVAYLDTLAEVEFRRGDIRRAIELAERCVELDPAGEHYREQLERFRAVEDPRRDESSSESGE